VSLDIAFSLIEGHPEPVSHSFFDDFDRVRHPTLSFKRALILRVGDEGKICSPAVILFRPPTS